MWGYAPDLLAFVPRFFSAQVARSESYSLRQKYLGYFHPTQFFFASGPSPRPPNVVYRS